ncbi:MAG: hypothetical protein VST71_06795 [Nitrospirota bacterium]|nr:hypothetical protein [Nitrospirota bacterium]
MDYIEDLEDVVAYDRAKKAGGETIPFAGALPRALSYKLYHKKESQPLNSSITRLFRTLRAAALES